MWGKQTYRLSDLDFEANAKEGIGVDWPIRYKDLAPWYDHVESYIGVSGRAEGLAHVPDGKFLPPMDLNCVEEVFRDKVAASLVAVRLPLVAWRILLHRYHTILHGAYVNRVTCATEVVRMVPTSAVMLLHFRLRPKPVT
jgi:hypothetical protein